MTPEGAEGNWAYGRDPQPIDVSIIPELARLADEVQRTRTPRLLRRNGRDIAVLMPVPRHAPAPTRARPGRRQTTTVDELADGFQSVPALDPPRTLQEMTDIAVEEHAQRVARDGR